MRNGQPGVFLIGEDVAEAGRPFKVLTGLVQEFGTDRVIDTPISEPGHAGIGGGAAMTGMRPVVHVMFGDFMGASPYIALRLGFKSTEEDMEESG